MDSNPVAVIQGSDLVPPSSKEFVDILTNYSVLIDSETRTWHDNNLESNGPYRKVFTTQLNHMTILVKWLNVRLWTKWLWVRIPLLSLKRQICCLLWVWSSLTFRKNIECGLTLNLVYDMKMTCSQRHLIGRYTQYSSIIWADWLNVWVLVEELGGYRFEPFCSHLNLRYGTCFKQGVPWHSGKL